MLKFDIFSSDAIQLMNTAPGNFLILKPDAPRFTIIGATDAYLEATFTQRSAITGKALFEVFTDNPENIFASGVKNLRASLYQVLEQKKPHQMADQRYDVWNEQKQAYEIKVWRPLNKPVLDEDGAVQAIFHYVADVTENAHLKVQQETAFSRFQESEEALRKSNERLWMLNKATQDAIWDWDLKTNLIWWNEGFKTLFGYADEDIEPGVESWYNRVHPDDKERVVNGIHDIIDKGGKHWSDEYRFRKKDGSYALVYDRGYALHDDDGTPYRMLGSMIDITERRKMEDTTRENEARIRVAVESAKLGTFEIDLEQQTILHSPRTSEIFGLDDNSQHSYSAFTGSIYPEDAVKWNQAHANAYKTGNLFYEVRIVSPDGIIRWIRVNGAITTSRNRKLLIGTVLDVTEEKKTAELLEQKIEERTHDLILANDQLKQFSYAASHDLQEPLRKISFFVERLLSGLDLSGKEESKKIADRIQHTVARMRTLIDDLLSYSNTTQGTMTPQEVSLTEVVQEVLDNMEATIIEKKATVSVADLPSIMGDLRQLKQLFQNLISNALKYHQPGQTPQVNVTWRQVKGSEVTPALPAEKAEQPFFEITVQDNGIGFSQEDAGRIFGLFQRLHGRHEYEGTGVGLAIVQKVVENHHGFIRAEGVPGQGARFHVLFPAGNF